MLNNKQVKSILKISNLLNQIGACVRVFLLLLGSMNEVFFFS